jgi:hypothetical protein
MSSQFFPTIPVYGANGYVVAERDAVLSGQCFSYSTAATGVLAKAADTSPVMMLWNNSVSQPVNLRIQRVMISAVSGSVIVGSLGWGIILNAGYAIGASGAPIISYTAAAATNRLVAGGKASQIAFAPATVSVTTAPAFRETWGYSSGGALAAGPIFSIDIPVNGQIVIPPGAAFFPFLSNAAFALTAIVTVVATEEPVLTGVNF